ncbi:alkaline phosphatase [Bacteroidota bacterium]
MRKLLISFLLFTGYVFFNGCRSAEIKTGSVIFIHPDGTGLSTWNAARLLYYGPDDELNWDKLSNIGLYRSHPADAMSTTSNAGATIHAYGIKANTGDYGLINGKIITARSGKKLSIMKEAQASGMNIGIVNSGNIVEPGTGVFVASELSRDMDEEIAEKIVQSGADVILSGGEEWLIPVDERGVHGKGKRKDGKNLIKEAELAGYYIVFNKNELLNIPENVTRLLGVFALNHTFSSKSEEDAIKSGLLNFYMNAPSVSEMTEAAIKILSKNDQQFFLVVEEEATDNFANKNNANGTLEALKRADDAIGVALNYYAEHPNTLIITAADSEAGGMEIIGDTIDKMNPNENLNETDSNGAPWDGVNGTGTKPFMTKPDKFDNSFPFAIAWSTTSDTYGSVVAKAEGLNAELLKGSIDNTEIYRIMYATLFGRILD